MECIYNFVEQTQPQKPKKSIYRSKYDPNGPLIGSTFGMHGTTVVDGKGFHSLKQNHVVISSFGRESEVSAKKRFESMFSLALGSFVSTIYVVLIPTS